MCVCVCVCVCKKTYRGEGGAPHLCSLVFVYGKLCELIWVGRVHEVVGIGEES